MPHDPDPAAPDGGRPRDGDLPPLRSDGLPTLPTGEPVLQRWFVIAMLVLFPVAIGVTVWGFLSIDRDEVTAAERRPAGGSEVTIERGEAMVAETQEVEPGPDCAQAVRLFGDEGSRGAARVAMRGACELIDSGDFPQARDGLVEWIAADGMLRMATFELSGVESSTRIEQDRMVMELNPKFQFEDAIAAAPAILHQLYLIADTGWPGDAVAASTELDAAEAQREACQRLEDRFEEEPPRGCLDAVELLEDDDPLTALTDVGFRTD